MRLLGSKGYPGGGSRARQSLICCEGSLHAWLQSNGCHSTRGQMARAQIRWIGMDRTGR
jgi:hypothetical protein